MKKYVLVGCGIRGVAAYAVPLVANYKDCGTLCGAYDTNKKRAEKVSQYTGIEVPAFDDFDEMLDTVKPDTVIIATRDCDHDDYIIRSLHHGCDVICEKPVTTDFQKALAIKKATEETGKEVRVTFNVRYSPFFMRAKELMNSGVIGDVLSVHFEWMLDTIHGADYFRRWHRQRKNSGSLLIHKSTHHFDAVNWLLEEDPISVNAFGTRRFYGPTREERSERCLTCPHKLTCEFYWDINTVEEAGKDYSDMYIGCEDEDGYIRDACVFSEEVDIEDSVCVNVNYSGGAIMSYSLTTHSPYEGLNLIINGTLGRMEIIGREKRRNYFDTPDEEIRIYNRRGELIRYSFQERSANNHGGADNNLLDNLFRGTTEDPLKQMAGLRAGLMSIGVGAAANISMSEGRQVKLSEFYEELKKYDK